MATLQTRGEMIALLKKGKCTVHFKKSTGEKTKRSFTLKESLMAETIVGKAGGTNKEVITVWDLENNGWRSFRVDSVSKDIILNT